MLWNSEDGRIMLVDFERSAILTRASHLWEISPNLKRRRLHSKGRGTMGLHSQGSSIDDQLSHKEGSLIALQVLR